MHTSARSNTRTRAATRAHAHHTYFHVHGFNRVHPFIHTLVHIHAHSQTHAGAPTRTLSHVHIHVQARIHTYSYTHFHTRAHARICTHTLMHTFTLPSTRAHVCVTQCVYAYVHTCAHAHICTQEHTYTHTCIRTRARHSHSRTHAHTRANLHTHSHIYPPGMPLLCPWQVHVQALLCSAPSSAQRSVLVTCCIQRFTLSWRSPLYPHCPACQGSHLISALLCSILSPYRSGSTHAPLLAPYCHSIRAIKCKRKAKHCIDKSTIARITVSDYGLT
jgi:hypothetical protein